MQLATLCYLKQNNKTLMLHRVKKENDMHEGKWNGLGGKFEPGETPEECVIREIEEESGLKIVNPTLHGWISFPAFDDIKDWFVFLFSATEFSGELIESDEGNLEWIRDEKITSLNLWEGDKIFMDWINKEKFFSAKFIYKNKKLKSHSVIFYPNKIN
jgi:8-oxo-dGTP diphosphatase